MLQYATCPNCKAYCPITSDKPAICPSCFTALSSVAGAGSAPSPNKTILADPEAMVRYTCPKCRKNLESPASFAGQKLNCPGCKQRLQIPLPTPSETVPSVNKTILAATTDTIPKQADGASIAASSPPGPAASAEMVEVVEDPPRSGRREDCLECGKDVSRQRRVQSCPDCGCALCSAQCYREHRYHSHDKRRKRRRANVECDYCGSTARPVVRSVISQGGWVLFAVLLVLFFPLCWIGLLMNEVRVSCYDCGRRLD